MSTESHHFYEFGPFRIDTAKRRLLRQGEIIPLAPKVFDTLLALVEQSGHTVEKDLLMAKVWPDVVVEENNLTQNISVLRKVLAAGNDNGQYIVTVPKLGYRFVADVNAVPPQAEELTIKEQTRSRIIIEKLNELDDVRLSTLGAAGETEFQTPQRKLDVYETIALKEAPGSVATDQAPQGAKGWRGNLIAEKFTPAVEEIGVTTSVVKGRRRWLLAVLLLALLGLGATVLWSVKIHRGPNETALAERSVVVKTTQLTFWKGLDFYPALSPDGKTIAFSSDRSGSFEIYIKQLVAGAHEVQLTFDGGPNFQPAFSPDGNLIAYYSKRRGGICVVPVTGGTAKQLTEFGSNPAWSRDGLQIAFQSVPLRIIGFAAMNARPPSTLWVVPSTGGEPRQLTQTDAPPGGHGSPSWSPDGKRIVFDASGGGGKVWSVSSQGNDLKNLSGRISCATDAVYAPDGRSIFFTADDGWSLYKISLSEAGDPIGEPVIVFSGSGPHIRKLSVADDGKSIVYCALSTMSNIWAIPLAPKTTEVSGKPVQLTQTANTCHVGPAFSPDGKIIAYFTYATGVPRQIWTMGADGRNPAQVTTGSGSFPCWFPDSRQIGFWSERENRLGFWSVTIEGGKEKKLFEFDEDIDDARLSPDGKRIAFTSKRGGVFNLWVVAIEGGQPRQLTFDKEPVDHLAWSPDGKWIAFERIQGVDSHVAIIPSDGGEPIQLTSDQGQRWVCDWSPDSEQVLFGGQRNGVWNVWSVSRLTKRQKQMTNYTKFDSYVRCPAWSPLGDRIAYEYADNTGNIWLMELK